MRPDGQRGIVDHGRAVAQGHRGAERGAIDLELDAPRGRAPAGDARIGHRGRERYRLTNAGALAEDDTVVVVASGVIVSLKALEVLAAKLLLAGW